MNRNRLVFEGLDDLRAELQLVKAEALAAEAQPKAIARAERAKQDIDAAYPERTGKLKRGLSARPLDRGSQVAAAEVRNTAPLAHIFENGTQARHTDLGANRGSMPPGHVFVPAVVRHRREWDDEIADMVEQHGLIVTGEAE